MNKYLMVIAKYTDWRQLFFDTYISPRNKEFAIIQGYEYIEIRDPDVFRPNGTWNKLYNVKKLLKNGFLKDGDDITVIDADVCIVNSKFPLISIKPLCYAIDSCNTHCMGYYNLKICDWTRNLIDNLLDDDFYRVNINNPFWAWSEQAALYYLCGLPHHSDISYLTMENYGFNSVLREYNKYSTEELLENIEVRNQNYNVTYIINQIDPRNSIIEKYYINHNKFDDMIIRHWAGNQFWNKKYFEIPLIK